jgi:hypothetical protein
VCGLHGARNLCEGVCEFRIRFSIEESLGG